MQFGHVTLDEAEGAILGHAVKAGDKRLAKGTRLSSADLALLRESGVGGVIAARLEPGDLTEDEAASAVSVAIAGDNLRFSPATTGRVNVFALANGLFRADRDCVDRLNRIDPAITLATLADRSDVKAGDMVATIKIIPLAVAGAAVNKAVEILGGCVPFALKPYSARKVGLIATVLPSLKPSVMDKTRALLERRLSASGSELTGEVRTAHTAEAVAGALKDAVLSNGIVIVFGASAVTDFRDVIPEAIRLAGGEVEQVGLPVDPGNLLVLGEISGVPVIGAPGCARSPKENAFDWVLSRILAGEKPSRYELTGLGVGGLLMEIPTRPLPRLGGDENRPARVATVILAAGQASRMGASGHHKLLARFGGEPLVRRSVAAVLASSTDAAVLVTGHRADAVETAIAGLDCPIVRNPDFASGMASSLRTGLAAVRDEADGILVMLADMPGITADHLDLLLDAFRKEKGRAIVRAVSDGKRGNPVILPSSTFEAVARLEGDIGARPIIERSGLPVLDIDIGPAAHLDTDTPEAIQAAGGVLAD
ncbi:molybdopterin-binding/glycosyltransferase family 2 protein [Rhizobium alvei]|uniref:Molybdopterin-binding/glycosyltransferase family 2 protein n=1 Tax=Rhizobium alvei TaxID=1132659 RepID=A0ABT8YHK8_9HYPH|nr:molybdopterin-binding/glycosyltransferase family 2 protein [Rhizobium alvei]MDO6963167.1 molybdopterin-binding/glycosyltransferase family 2 protein [Rhizobium alvei]